MSALSYASDRQFSPLALELSLPWEEDSAQLKSLTRLLKIVFALLLVAFIVVPWLPTVDKVIAPEIDLSKTQIILDPADIPLEKLPEPVVEPEKPKPVVPPKVKQKEKVKPKPKSKVVKQAPKKNTEVKKPKRNVSKKPQVKKPSRPVDRKAELMKSMGFAGSTSAADALASDVNIDAMKIKNVKNSRQGKIEASRTEVIRQSTSKDALAGTVSEAMMARESVSALDEHNSLKVVSSVDMNDHAQGRNYEEYLSGKAGRRDLESIRRKLEAAKSRVFPLYQRALTERPDLSGKFEFYLVIESSGKISKLKLVKSDLNFPDLERNILNRIQGIRFGAMDVQATAIEYKFIFFPS